MAEDEQKIGKAYQTWLIPMFMFGPVLAAVYLPPDKVVFVCVGLGLAMLHEIGGRLHDLCIRLRRTNILVRDQGVS